MVSILRTATSQRRRSFSLILILFWVSFPGSLAIQSSFEPGAHIVGGVDSIEPVFARVSYTYKWTTGWFFWARYYTRNNDCGGVIINKTAILTAAHCVYLNKMGGYTGIVPTKAVTVYTGGSFAKKDSRRTTVKSSVKSIHMPEQTQVKKNFVPGFDIAVLILKKPLFFDSHRQPVEPCNSSIKFNKTIHMMTVVGAGKLAHNKDPNQLQELEVGLYTYIKGCLKGFLMNSTGIPPQSIVCFYGMGGVDGTNRKNICKGDSGGPLLLKTRGVPRKNICVYGISSFSDGNDKCQERRWYSVATKVSYHLPLIESTLGTSNLN